MNPYETQRYLNEYLLFHYGTPTQKAPFHFAPHDAARFHERLVPECVLPLKFPSPTRGLDLGCAVGRLTFELARIVDHATGVDNARLLIHAARRMASNGKLEINRMELKGDHTQITVRLPRPLRRCKVTFKLGDALNHHQSPVNVLLAINLICRISNPRKFLNHAADLVLPGGQFVLGSPHSWLTQYTPRRNWLTPDQIVKILQKNFRLVRRKDIPFLIRETQRKYQWVVSDVMTFVRRAK